MMTCSTIRLIQRVGTVGLSLVVLGIGNAGAQGERQPLLSHAPLERNNFERVSSHEELVDFVQTAVGATAGVTLEFIGRSVESRPIPMLRIRRGDNRRPHLKVLVFCQQHGNEPSGKEAALMLLRKIPTGELDTVLAELDVLLIPSVNPDGNEAGRRMNARNKDLNRNHILLDEPEVLAVHDVFRREQPEVTLDVHEFGALSESWLRQGYYRSMDAQFGAPTNLNVARRIRDEANRELFPFLRASLAAQGWKFFNYAIMGPPSDTVRHSTTSINDGRQSFAILNSFSFILEGRNGGELNAELERRSKTQLAAMESFLAYCALHASRIRTMVREERQRLIGTEDSVIVRMDHHHTDEAITIPVRTVPGGRDSTVGMAYAPVVRSLASVRRPAGYVIPRAEKEILQLLARHGITMDTLDRDRTITVEQLTVPELTQVSIEGDSIIVPTVQTAIRLVPFRKGDVIVPTRQLHSSMIAITLEPASMWGLIQYEAFARLRNPDTPYPVYRIVDRSFPEPQEP